MIFFSDMNVLFFRHEQHETLLGFLNPRPDWPLDFPPPGGGGVKTPLVTRRVGKKPA